MDISVRLDQGPMSIEITADTEEDYESEVLNVLDFLEENSTRLEKFGLAEEFGEVEMSETGTDAKITQEWETDESEEGEEDPIAPLSERVGLPEDKLKELFDIDPEGEDIPLLIIDDAEVLGDSKVKRQRSAALMLLLVYEVCYGEERMGSSDLKDSLADSRIEETNLFQIYNGDGERYFDTRGRGPSATVGLKRPGRRQARKEIRNLIDRSGA